MMFNQSQVEIMAIFVSGVVGGFLWLILHFYYGSKIEAAENAAQEVTAENVALRVAMDAMVLTVEALIIRDETLKALDKKLIWG